MKTWGVAVCLLALLITAEAQGQTCVTSTATWQNLPVTAQNTDFTAEVDATPQAAAMDGVLGYARGPATGYNSLAVTARFNSSGLIDARNGLVYAASASVPYSVGTAYHFRFVVSVTNRTYSVYVKSGAGAEVLVASAFAFRTEWVATLPLDTLGVYASIGSETVCLAAATPPPASPPSPPPISGSLAWDASVVDATHGAAVSYNVKCGTSSGAYTLVRTTTQTTLPLKDMLSATGTYFCIVTGVNLAGESLPSNEVTFQVAVAAYPPAAPVLRAVP